MVEDKAKAGLADVEIPKQHLEAERAVLGSMMIEDSGARWGLRNIESVMFWDGRNRIVSDAIAKVCARGDAADPITVAAQLRDDKKDVSIVYLQKCVGEVTTAKHVAYYGKLVLRAYYDRELVKAVVAVKNADDRDKALDGVARVCRARDMVDARGAMSLSDALGKVLDGFDSGPTKLIYTGLERIDRLIGGQELGDLMVVGARTGVGKTALLLSIALMMSRAGHRVAFCAGEMGGEQVAKRALASESGVEHWRIRARKLSPDHKVKLSGTAGEIAGLPIHFCTIPSPTLRDIKAFSDSVRATVVIVDYLTRCTLPFAESLRVRVNLFMQGLKNFARETNRVVILAAQINRLTDKTPDKPPQLSDLKESSAIEEEADQVLLLHVSAEAKIAEGTIPLGAALAKNRHGTVGVTDLTFNKPIVRVYGSFEELPPATVPKTKKFEPMRADAFDKRKDLM